MTTNNPHDNTGAGGIGGGATGSVNGSAYASARSVSGLAREIEALRRDLDPLLAVPARLDELAALVAQLADATAATSPGGGGVPSWLDLPAHDRDLALAVLTKLARWMEIVYLRYPDGAQFLPECWLWHPDVVEELLWLMHAWLAAYHDEHAPVCLAADWHDRYRPGVVRRIQASAGRCSLENHQPRDSTARPGGPMAPVIGAVEPIAAWWATHRTDPAPHPHPDHLADAATQRRPGTRR